MVTPSCLLHLCPPEYVDAFHTHSYMCHSHPPDLEWATHEVKRMVRFEVARNPFGKIGLRGYSKALQKYNMQLQQRPYAPYQEKDYWSAMRTSISLPVLQAACAILVNYSKVASGDDERLRHEVAALRSDAFWWIDFICKHLADESTQRRPQPANKPQYRWLLWPMTATSRWFRDHQVLFAKI